MTNINQDKYTREEIEKYLNSYGNANEIILDSEILVHMDENYKWRIENL